MLLMNIVKLNRLQFFKPSISWALEYKYILAIENQYHNTSFFKKLRKTSADKETSRSLRGANAGLYIRARRSPCRSAGWSLAGCAAALWKSA